MTHLDLYMHVQLWAYICGWSTVSWSLLKEQEQSFWGSIYVIFECTEEMSSAPRNSEILLEWCTEECMVNYRGACKLEVHALVLIFDMCNLSSLPPPPPHTYYRYCCRNPFPVWWSGGHGSGRHWHRWDPGRYRTQAQGGIAICAG